MAGMMLSAELDSHIIVKRNFFHVDFRILFEKSDVFVEFCKMCL